MVWPITVHESYVGEMGKSMKATGMAVAQGDSLCNIAVTLTVRQNVESPLYNTLLSIVDGLSCRSASAVLIFLDPNLPFPCI
jgi:hypothetical protein